MTVIFERTEVQIEPRKQQWRQVESCQSIKRTEESDTTEKKR